MIITLPWPDRRLSPNARLHWRAKVGPKQAARIAAQHATVAAKGFYSVRKALDGTEGPIPITVRFYPPDRRHRDDDNMIGSLKHARDGIAEVLRVDDRRFRPHYFFEDACKPGRVEVEFPGEKYSADAASDPLKGGSDQCANTKSEPDHERTGDAS